MTDFTTQHHLSRALKKQPFENMVAKGENVGDHHFLPFPTAFSSYPKLNIYF